MFEIFRIFRDAEFTESVHSRICLLSTKGEVQGVSLSFVRYLSKFI